MTSRDKIFQVVLDTNVLITALRSQRGASYRLLSQVGGARWELNLSVPLFLEYEAVAKRREVGITLAPDEIDNVLSFLCAVANLREVFYLWRPFLPDSKDDLILELAVESGCDFIITFNVRDFTGSDKFGIRAITPREFLRELGELP